MEIERKDGNIVLTCSEIEAGVIASMLDNDRAQCCSWDCPYWKARDCCDEQACIEMAKQIRTFLPLEEPTPEDDKIYLSGPAWLTRYECEVFNTVAAICEKDYNDITISPEALCEAVRGKASSTEIIEINRIVRKLALTRRDTKESILAGWAHDILNVDLVMMPDNFWGLRIMCPSVERLRFEDIVYLGGSTGRFH